MTKILNLDELEIDVEKQSPNHSCKWCLFVKVKKGKKEKLFLMFKINKKPILHWLVITAYFFLDCFEIFFKMKSFNILLFVLKNKPRKKLKKSRYSQILNILNFFSYSM